MFYSLEKSVSVRASAGPERSACSKPSVFHSQFRQRDQVPYQYLSWLFERLPNPRDRLLALLKFTVAAVARAIACGVVLYRSPGDQLICIKVCLGHYLLE